MKSQQSDLETMIPRNFGDWRRRTAEYECKWSIRNRQELINKIYTQTLNRTYVNNNGYRIMLAIAYGDDQRDSMQMHYPEVCYPAQGFSLQGKEKGTLTTENGSIPVTRILTNLGSVMNRLLIGRQSATKYFRAVFRRNSPR